MLQVESLKVPWALHTASIGFTRLKRQQSTLVGVAFHFHPCDRPLPNISCASLNAAGQYLGSCNTAYRLNSFSDVDEVPLLSKSRPVRVADSTGQRNSLMESLSWSFVLQRLPWSFVETPSDRVELGLRIF